MPKILLPLSLLVGGFALGYLAHSPLSNSTSEMTPSSSQGRAPAPVRDELGEQLLALGYTDGTLDAHPDRSGVLVHEPESAPGVNFYTSHTVHAAHLIDAEGHELHTWQHKWGPWQHAHLFPNGDVLVVVPDERLFKLDKDSNVLWSLKGRFHHDFSVSEGGLVYALRHKAEVLDRVHPEARLLVDYLSLVSPAGVELERHSLVDALLDSEHAYLLPRPWPGNAGTAELDLLHANHVEVFDGRLAERSPLFARGNLLVSMRHLDAILIMEARTHEVLWLWGPSNIILQHHPSLLDTGHLLLFNNGVTRSSILELDPLTHEITWAYRGEDFFSETRGSVQRLENGNTLITESDSGYVFEVTPEGRVVWEFANPDISAAGLRGAIWRMTRHDPDSLEFLAPPPR